MADPAIMSGISATRRRGRKTLSSIRAGRTSGQRGRHQRGLPGPKQKPLVGPQVYRFRASLDAVQWLKETPVVTLQNEKTQRTTTRHTPRNLAPNATGTLAARARRRRDGRPFLHPDTRVRIAASASQLRQFRLSGGRLDHYIGGEY